MLIADKTEKITNFQTKINKESLFFYLRDE
jgi:hypothetical protein